MVWGTHTLGHAHVREIIRPYVLSFQRPDESRPHFGPPYLSHFLEKDPNVPSNLPNKGDFNINKNHKKLSTSTVVTKSISNCSECFDCQSEFIERAHVVYV